MDPRAVWSSVDAYFRPALAPEADSLQALLDANAAAGLPAIDVSPLQGKFLHLLALAVGARRILEIGTLGGLARPPRRRGGAAVRFRVHRR